MPQILIPFNYYISVPTTSSLLRVTLGDTQLFYSRCSVSLNYTGSSKVEVTVPGLDVLENLPDTLRVYYLGRLLLSGRPLSSFVASPDSNFTTLSFETKLKYVVSGSVTVSAVTGWRSDTSGKVSTGIPAGLFIRPGNTFVSPYGSIEVGSVRILDTDNSTLIDITELTEGDKESRERVEFNNPDSYSGVRGIGGVTVVI